MMRLSIYVAVVALLMPALPAKDVVSVEGIRALVTSGEYRNALDEINRQLILTTRNQPSRYDLLMLKGECHLQLKDRVGARTAFKSAEKEAKDVKDMAAARAQALIVERSNSGRFTPAIGQGGEPIPIILIDDRKRAMTMLQDELWAKYKPDVDAALRAEQLAPIEKIFSSIADIYSLELFVTGDSAKAGDVMRQLGAHTYELMTNDVAKKASRVDYLMQVANSAVDFGHGWASTRTGLTSPQRNEVKEMIPYLTQVQKRASEYRGIASRLGGDEAKWNGLVADTTDALNDAESLADDR